MNQKLIKSLSKQPLFKNTPEDVLTKVAQQVKIHNLDEGEIVVHKGDPSQSLFIIHKGWLKVVGQGSDSEEVILNHVGPGQIIGEMSVIDQKPRSNTIAVLKAAEILEIDYEAILNIIQEHPILAISLLSEMSSRVRFANAYIEEAVQWCRHMANGNYNFVQEQITQSQSTIIDITRSDQARASAFLSVFFRMVEGVKEREDQLKQQVYELTIQIDEVRRQQSVQELTETSFFEDLRSAALKLRQERKGKKKE